MNAAETVALPGEQVTSWREMCALFPDQWVVLVEADWVDHSMREFRSARVVGHGKRAEIEATARTALRQYGRCGTFFTGKIRAPFPRFFVR